MAADPLFEILDQVDQPPSQAELCSGARQGTQDNSSLDQLLEESVKHPTPPVVKSSPPQWPSGAARGIGKVHYTHDAMINLMIANPGISQNALARHFGYTPSWISQVINSDAFKAKLLERTGELVDPAIRASVEEQLQSLMSRSLDILRQKMNEPDALKIPDNLVIRSLELSSRALGYGAREQTVAVQVNVDNHLNDLGGRLVKLLHTKKAEASGDFSESETIEG
jgi:hypothetical protein